MSGAYGPRVALALGWTVQTANAYQTKFLVDKSDRYVKPVARSYLPRATTLQKYFCMMKKFIQLLFCLQIISLI